MHRSTCYNVRTMENKKFWLENINQFLQDLYELNLLQRKLSFKRNLSIVQSEKSRTVMNAD